MPATPAYRALIDAVARLQRVQRETATELARDLDCPRAALSLLWLLDKRGEMGTGDIAQHLHVDISVASRQITTLVDAGYAERSTPDAPGTDRRVRTVRLTALGQAFTARTKQELDARAAAVFSGWALDDLLSATAQIERVADTIAGLSPLPATAGDAAPAVEPVAAAT
ncbi:MarR family winged helix-turn-helix transcriptional regulator [Cellulomonas sp. C5510]|uniref:MarR family winged helix-turn-helix transcriptional regulator n=1 Tax=Cellulomonas sp. C5510 TaxID=2871170 RepID=UPI001C98E199|nr:MarR family transcriptional regulator [Cellulomonas sp. C5510]QZN85134.1 MarR family transcriptional regulator [Cellulomonas sp. C5510]